MKKICLLIAALSALTACGPAYYYQRPRTTARVAVHTRSIVQERLDRRSYKLHIEREIRPQRGNVSAVIDIPDFTLSVRGDRLHNSRERNADFRINGYSDSGNSRRRVIRFSNYNRNGRSLEGRYELTVYPEGNFRLIIRNRGYSVKREYEGRIDLGPDGPGPNPGPGHGHRPGPAPRPRR